jgi:hypothetical protein
VRHSGYGNRLRSMTSSAKGPGERCGAHRGLELAGETAQGGRQRGPSGGDRRSSRRKKMQGPPCFWSPWVDSWRSCEGPTGVRKVRGSPTVRNCKSGAGYRQRSSGSIPARAGLGVEGGSLGEFPGGEAKLRWGLAGAGAQQGGRPTAEQFKDGAGGLGVRAPVEIAAVIRGRSGLCNCSARSWLEEGSF